MDNEKPIRIAQMMTDMNYGGVEVVITNYYRHIDKSKFQFDFFALEGSAIPQKDEIEKLGGRVFVVPRYTHFSKYENAIQTLFKENQYKIVHCHMNTLGVFAMYGAKKAGIPIRILHNHSTAGKGETKKNIVKYALRPFSKLFPTNLCACSRFAGKWIYGKKARFDIFKNAIDLNLFKYNPTIRNELRKDLSIDDKYVVGHVGRFCYQKNHEFLVEVFMELLEKKKDAVLMLLGEGELEADIKEKIINLGICDKVMFIGSKPDVYKYYQAMDIFLLPSRYEGLGMVAIEAQASGLPTICSTEVPEEAKVTELVKFIPLKSGPKKWADSIFSTKRRDMSDEIKAAGYDIIEATKNLENYYYKLLQQEEQPRLL